MSVKSDNFNKLIALFFDINDPVYTLLYEVIFLSKDYMRVIHVLVSLLWKYRKE